jgi:hypothetical protein
MKGGEDIRGGRPWTWDPTYGLLGPDSSCSLWDLRALDVRLSPRTAQGKGFHCLPLLEWGALTGHLALLGQG